MWEQALYIPPSAFAVVRRVWRKSNLGLRQFGVFASTGRLAVLLAFNYDSGDRPTVRALLEDREGHNRRSLARRHSRDVRRPCRRNVEQKWLYRPSGIARKTGHVVRRLSIAADTHLTMYADHKVGSGNTDV